MMGDATHVLGHAEEHILAAGGDPSVTGEKKQELGEEVLVATLRRLLLQAYDMFWIEHLDTMEHLRNSVNLRSYGGRDPFIEYRREGLKLFRDLEASLARFIAEAVPRIQRPSTAQIREGTPMRMTVSGPKRYERNDHVKITNGTKVQEMKFKKAEPLLQQGWRIVE